MTTYVLVSDLKSDILRAKLISVKPEMVRLEMLKQVKNYVIDNVGKNNFIDTLSDEYKNLPVEKCPEGYVLKYDEIVGKITIYIHTLIRGYLYNKHEIEMIGYFQILPVITQEQTEKKIDKALIEKWRNLTPELKAAVDDRNPTDPEQTKPIKSIKRSFPAEWQSIEQKFAQTNLEASTEFKRALSEGIKKMDEKIAARRQIESERIAGN